ncbi:putative oxidoreductase YusZ [Ceratocystis fimbriata CBS 114723]|uniref:Putative oxidoreductase YusZ n=1 Tax=Ceratocystis fimbriata CBS 114723 TaxID=1035309 RepID=A0A2C5X3X9_9PEZI|nr:putative oxidoreductase YusZ [Ceratocystis fimbriata CBS 114723]
MSPVWLITGASKGLGFALANKTLDSGHRVIAVIRNKSSNAEAVATIEGKGGKVVELEMGSSQDTIIAAIREAEKIFGAIDVLVNNAGQSGLAPLEDVSEKDVHAMMATNLYGPMYAMQAVIPGMRDRKSGLIINVSSAIGLTGLPGGSLYAATKFALEGVTESTSKDLAAFGIEAMCVEPGAFATTMVVRTKALYSAPYKGTDAGNFLDMVAAGLDKSKLGDPDKAAARIFEYATRQGAAGALRGKTNRLMLGADCIEGVGKKVEQLTLDFELNKPIGVTTGFDS